MTINFRFPVLYNGKEGYSSTFIKLAIHAFYLLHLTVIILIKELLIV